MKLPFFGRRAAAILAAAALPLAATAATAQAASSPHGSATAQAAGVKGGVTPDFTCPDRTVCLFPNNDFTGNYPGWGGPAQLPTDVDNGQWYSFNQVAASNPNPGSLNDNSGSIVWVYAKDANAPACLNPGRWVLSHSFGYFFIRFGIHSCTGQSVPRPLP
jgi:hypothetical protein